MKKIFFALLFLFSVSGFSQETISELLDKYNTKSVPYITVQELAMPKTKAIILDAREHDEYKVSHLKESIFVGFNNFQIESIQIKLPNKNETIVVYCSLGIRSETIANKLKKAGYKNVFNLYGGIFEWKNNNFKVYNSEGKETDNIHAFSKEWSRWLLKGNKVY
jgi:rhodanese-related sulfurtransferase